MMSIFRLPDGLIDEIHSLFARFWWGSNCENRKIHWHRWSQMCLPKNMGGMGFRDLKCFNAALLAKQAWRLLEGSNYLLVETLKARYFKHSSIIEAGRGYDPSYTWRSIWGAKSLLLEGLGWRVGNGCSISVWNDKWVPDGETYVSPIGKVDAPPDLMVKDLIDHCNNCWDLDILGRCFDDTTVKAILSLPLSKNRHVDNLFWWKNKNGVYSVKSGYWMGILGHQMHGSSNVATPDHKCWKIVWNVSGPPKLRHFLWNACKGSLATKWVLYQRYCVPSSICDRCTVEHETIIHALCDCTSIASMWYHHTSASLLRDAPRTNFSEFFVWLHDHTSMEDFSSICSLFWAGWFIRNKAIFEGESCDPVSIATKYHSLVADYNLYNRTIAVVHQSKILQFQSWNPPAVGWVKVNFDAHIGTAAERGLRVVIRDHVGALLAAGTRRVEAEWSVEASEAAAALFGIDLALRLGYVYIHLEGDAMNVVQTIENKGEGCSPLHLLYDCINFSNARCMGFGCSYVKRSGNAAAHCVSRWDTGVANEKVCMYPFPQGLRTLAALDLS